jgi:hypothetical protein
MHTYIYIHSYIMYMYILQQVKTLRALKRYVIFGTHIPQIPALTQVHVFSMHKANTEAQKLQP